MNYVYILQSERNGKYYIGSTNNIERRLLEHNYGKTKSLQHILPVRLVFKQEFGTLLEARKVELKSKKNKSRSIIERIIEDGKITSTGL